MTKTLTLRLADGGYVTVNQIAVVGNGGGIMTIPVSSITGIASHGPMDFDNADDGMGAMSWCNFCNKYLPLNYSARAVKLAVYGKTVAEVTKVPISRIRNTPHIGGKTIVEVQKALAKFGLHFFERI